MKRGGPCQQVVTIEFGAAVVDPILHLFSFASTLHFDPGMSLTELSDDGNLGVEFLPHPSPTLPPLPQVRGTAIGSTDANGSVRINGSFTQLKFVVDYLGAGRDEFHMQISTDVAATGGSVPEPGTLALVGLAGLGFLCRPRRAARSRP